MALTKRQKRSQLRKQAADWPILYPKKKPRLYLDEQLPPSFIDDLADRHIDAVHPMGLGYQGQDDGFHWEKAKSLGRTLVTANWRDFWSDRKFALNHSPGVIILDTGSKQNWQRALTLLVAFSDYMKTFVRGPFGGAIMERTKIRLTCSRITWRILTFEGQVSDQIRSWGPWW